jgi:ribosome-associated protein
MQPTIRQYYHLEEIWGDKPVRLKLGADKPRMPVKIESTPEPSKKVAKKSAVKTSRGKTAATSKPTTTSAKKTPRPAAKSATKPAAKTSSKPAKKPAVKKVVVNKPPAKKLARQKTKA